MRSESRFEEIDQAPVSITLIQPTAAGTPFPQHARNYIDREPKLPTPQIQPDDVAEAVLDAAQNPTRDKKVGAGAVLNTVAAKLIPGLAHELSAQQADRQQYDEAQEILLAPCMKPASQPAS